jgi:hypothetical protein
MLIEHIEHLVEHWPPGMHYGNAKLRVPHERVLQEQRVAGRGAEVRRFHGERIDLVCRIGRAQSHVNEHRNIGFLGEREIRFEDGIRGTDAEILQRDLPERLDATRGDVATQLREVGLSLEN